MDRIKLAATLEEYPLCAGFLACCADRGDDETAIRTKIARDEAHRDLWDAFFRKVAQRVVADGVPEIVGTPKPPPTQPPAVKPITVPKAPAPAPAAGDRPFSPQGAAPSNWSMNSAQSNYRAGDQGFFGDVAHWAGTGSWPKASPRGAPRSNTMTAGITTPAAPAAPRPNYYAGEGGFAGNLAHRAGTGSAPPLNPEWNTPEYQAGAQRQLSKLAPYVGLAAGLPAAPYAGGLAASTLYKSAPVWALSEVATRKGAEKVYNDQFGVTAENEANALAVGRTPVEHFQGLAPHATSREELLEHLVAGQQQLFRQHYNGKLTDAQYGTLRPQADAELSKLYQQYATKLGVPPEQIASDVAAFRGSKADAAPAAAPAPPPGIAAPPAPEPGPGGVGPAQPDPTQAQPGAQPEVAPAPQPAAPPGPAPAAQPGAAPVPQPGAAPVPQPGAPPGAAPPLPPLETIDAKSLATMDPAEAQARGTQADQRAQEFLAKAPQMSPEELKAAGPEIQGIVTDRIAAYAKANNVDPAALLAKAQEGGFTPDDLNMSMQSPAGQDFMQRVEAAGKDPWGTFQGMDGSQQMLLMAGVPLALIGIGQTIFGGQGSGMMGMLMSVLGIGMGAGALGAFGENGPFGGIGKQFAGVGNDVMGLLGMNETGDESGGGEPPAAADPGAGTPQGEDASVAPQAAPGATANPAPAKRPGGFVGPPTTLAHPSAQLGNFTRDKMIDLQEGEQILNNPKLRQYMLSLPMAQKRQLIAQMRAADAYVPKGEPTFSGPYDKARLAMRTKGWRLGDMSGQVYAEARKRGIPPKEMDQFLAAGG